MKILYLQNLNLSCCNGITDKGIRYLKGLHHLDISECHQIKDGIRDLEMLQYLDISNCKHITDVDIIYLADKGKLCELTLLNNISISSECKKYLKSKCVVYESKLILFTTCI